MSNSLSTIKNAAMQLHTYQAGKEEVGRWNEITTVVL
jgi:hypothetical protein